MNVNVWDVHSAIRSLIKSGIQVDVDALSDTAVPLTDLAE
jgi:hypothetical protein